MHIPCEKIHVDPQHLRWGDILPGARAGGGSGGTLCEVRPRGEQHRCGGGDPAAAGARRGGGVGADAGHLAVAS